MREAVLHLYGQWPGETTQPQTDGMFDRRDKHQKAMASAEYGDVQLGYDIGYCLSAPSNNDHIPADILVARNPIFDHKGTLIEADFKPDDITEYPVILDHYIARFRQERLNEKGLTEEFASGIGISPERLINPYSVQNYGNNKRAAERDVLGPSGVALKSYNISPNSMQQLTQEWGKGEYIFKPDAGALSKGIRTFDTLQALETAIANGEIADNGQIQPFIDLTAPIPNLKALESHFDAQLDEVNRVDDRVREIRMHFFATTVNGLRRIEAFPTLRSSQPGSKIMENWTYTALDPEAFAKYYGQIVESTKNTASRLLDMTGVPHAYGVCDVSTGISGHEEKRRTGDMFVTFTGDFNVRGPRLPDVSTPDHDVFTPAQKAFMRHQKTIASLVLASQ